MECACFAAFGAPDTEPSYSLGVPFRSETEPLREQIRRVEEQASELIEERAALEAQLTAQRAESNGLRRKLVAFAAVLAAVATSFVGFVAGDFAADKRATQWREHREQRQGEESAGVLRAARECSQLRGITESSLVVCDEERANARRLLELPAVPRPTRRDPWPSGGGGLR